MRLPRFDICLEIEQTLSEFPFWNLGSKIWKVYFSHDFTVTQKGQWLFERPRLCTFILFLFFDHHKMVFLKHIFFIYSDLELRL